MRDDDLDEDGWTPGPIVAHEGCTLVAQANWAALEAELKSRPDWMERWTLSGAQLPDVGQVWRLTYQATDRTHDGLPRFLEAWFRELAHQHIADPGILLQLEAEAYRSQLEQDLATLSDDIGGLSSDDLDELAEELGSLLVRYDIDGTPYHTERDILLAASRRGLADGIIDRRVVNPPRYAAFRNAENAFVAGRVVGGDPLGNFVQIEDADTIRRGRRVRKHWAFDRGDDRYELITNVTPRMDRELNPADAAPIGGLVGWWAGAIWGALSLGMSVLGGWSIAALGGAVGAYVAAQPPNRRRAAIGAGVGGVIFPIVGIGAAVGAHLGSNWQE